VAVILCSRQADVVGELLDHLEGANVSLPMRPEIVLKIAVLAERLVPLSMSACLRVCWVVWVLLGSVGLSGCLFVCLRRPVALALPSCSCPPRRYATAGEEADCQGGLRWWIDVTVRLLASAGDAAPSEVCGVCSLNVVLCSYDSALESCWLH
jgi:hypothetical protein